jgi:S1-C subfamily serine protease
MNNKPGLINFSLSLTLFSGLLGQTVMAQTVSNLSQNDLENVAREVTVEILNIQGAFNEGENNNARGSGVIISGGNGSNNYYILTNRHVGTGQSLDLIINIIQPMNVDQPGELRVTEIQYPNHVCPPSDAANPETPDNCLDLALLKINYDGDLRVARTGSSLNLEVNQPLIVFGFPRATVDQGLGLVHAQFREMGAEGDFPPLSYSAVDGNSFKTGMSGGSVLDNQGQLVGIHVAGGRSEGRGIQIEFFLNDSKFAQVLDRLNSDAISGVPPENLVAPRLKQPSNSSPLW